MRDRLGRCSITTIALAIPAGTTGAIATITPTSTIPTTTIPIASIPATTTCQSTYRGSTIWIITATGNTSATMAMAGTPASITAGCAIRMVTGQWGTRTVLPGSRTGPGG